MHHERPDLSVVEMVRDSGEALHPAVVGVADTNLGSWRRGMVGSAGIEMVEIVVVEERGHRVWDVLGVKQVENPAADGVVAEEVAP